MGNFAWKDSVVIDFGGGVSFDVPNDTAFVKGTVMKANDTLQTVVEQNADDEKACINALLDAIDMVLGEGATGKIFAGHTLNLCNTMNVYIHIVDEILTQVNGYMDTLNSFTEKTKVIGALNAPQVNDTAKQEAFDNAAHLGVPLSAVPSARPRL